MMSKYKFSKRTKITTEIDGDLRLMYGAIQDKAKPTLRQLIERGMIEYLREKDPISALEAEIEINERKLQEEREMLAEIRIYRTQEKMKQELTKKAVIE